MDTFTPERAVCVAPAGARKTRPAHPGHMPVGWLAILSVLASGCNLFEEACPPPPAQDQQSYVPFQVGQRWVFDYDDYESVLPFRTHTQGTLTWHVASERCHSSERLFRIEESFRGEAVTTSGESEHSKPVQWDTTRTFAFGKELDLDRYTVEPIRWRYAAASPDTVVINQAACLSETGCLEIVLARGKGLVRHTRNRHLFASASFSTILVLMETRAD